MKHQFFDHSQGCFALVADHDVLVGILWRDSRAAVGRDLHSTYPASLEGSSSLLLSAWGQIEKYLAGDLTELNFPVAIRGVTSFQKRVLQTLQNCPYGATVSYGELAEQAGSPRAARAVGAAMAANPLPLRIPCHRVMGAGGKLTGFSGGRGVASKKFLLNLEHSRKR